MRFLLYTWSTCSFCRRAKELLEVHGLEWEERVLDGDREAVRRQSELFGGPRMPFVWLDDEPLGGLAELERWLAQRSPG